MNFNRFEGKVAIVTGGASGIGEETARRFYEEGASVVIADFADKGQEVADSFGDRGLFVKVDVTSEADTKKMIDETIKKFGKLDVMFANAGIAKDGDIDKLSEADWRRTIDINLTGVYLSDKYAIEQMLKQGNGGSVVNCGSIHSLVGRRGVTAYAAAKGGVKLLTQTLGATYAKDGIRINAVGPGYISTPLIEKVEGERRQALINDHPIGRLGKAEEVAAAVAFLASDEASFIAGALLPVDGGYTAI